MSFDESWWNNLGAEIFKQVKAKDELITELADALRRVLGAGIRLDGAADHGVSEALYLRDPDDNGVELYWDRPKEEWPRDADGGLAMFTRALDLEALSAVRKQL